MLYCGRTPTRVPFAETAVGPSVGGVTVSIGAALTTETSNVVRKIEKKCMLCNVGLITSDIECRALCALLYSHSSETSANRGGDRNE